MTKQIQILIGLLAFLGIGLCFLLSNLGDDPPRPDNGERGTSRPTGTESRPGKALQGKSAEGARTEIAPGNPGVGKAAAADTRQGIRGFASSAGQPLQHARTYLLLAPGQHALANLRLHKRDQRAIVVAQTTTGRDGRFELPVRTWEAGRKYELRIVHDDHCEARRASIELQAGQWLDVGAIVMIDGVTVLGKVTNEAGVAVAGARIRARNMAVANLLPTPGEADGLATTDANGEYRLQHVHPDAVLDLHASANTYATESRIAVHIEVTSETRVDFQMSPGQTIAGSVKNSTGIPIAGGTITVASLNPMSPHAEVARSDENGTFFVHGLQAGFHVVTVEAEGYERFQKKPVAAGRKDLMVTMVPAGTVTLTVLDKDGAPQKDYRCNLRVVLDDHDTLSNTLVQKNVQGSTDGTTTLGGISPATYVAEIIAAGHASGLSERFTVTRNHSVPVRIQVRLGRGGAVHGFVKDPAGKPVSGAKVSTLVDGEEPRTVVTSQSGEFTLDLLGAGAHTLQVRHPGFCPRRRHEVAVTTGRTTELGDLRMDPGCAVSGIVRAGGQGAAGMRVKLASVIDKKKAAVDGFRAETVTDSKGRFRIHQRVPAGRYTVGAAREQETNPLARAAQHNSSLQTIEIPAGQRSRRLDIQIDAGK